MPCAFLSWQVAARSLYDKAAETTLQRNVFARLRDPLCVCAFSSNLFACVLHFVYVRETCVFGGKQRWCVGHLCADRIHNICSPGHIPGVIVHPSGFSLLLFLAARAFVLPPRSANFAVDVDGVAGLFGACLLFP